MVHSAIEPVVPRVLIVSPEDLLPQLGRTVLWRRDVERVQVEDAEAGFEKAKSLMPNLLVLDGRDPAAAAAMIQRVRSDGATRRLSVVVLGRGLRAPDEEALRRAGANLVVAGPILETTFWDARLEELLNVPRRRETRIPAAFDLWCRSEDVPEEWATVLNISVRGMLIETSRPLAIGTTVDLRLKLPDGDTALNVVAQVVWQVPGQETPCRSGVQFVLLREEARDRIRAFIGSTES